MIILWIKRLTINIDPKPIEITSKPNTNETLLHKKSLSSLNINPKMIYEDIEKSLPMTLALR